MNERAVLVLTRWPFLVALSLLLFNDFWLKAAHPGFVTGKLSDFAGIALIALPLLAAFPARAKTIYVAIALAFVWWKSPASDGFIAIANDLLPYSIGRVVDYGDLFALLVLPLCRFAVSGDPLPIRAVRRRLAVPAAIVALFATTATSYVAPRFDLTIRTIDPNGTLPAHVIVASIEEVAKDYGLECNACSQPLVHGNYRRSSVGLGYRVAPPNAVRISITQGGMLFGNSSGRKAERIREALKRSFLGRVKGLEAVQPLERGNTRQESHIDPRPREGAEPPPPAIPPPAAAPEPPHPKPRPAAQDPAPAPVA
jgi:hypothetical protein